MNHKELVEAAKKATNAVFGDKSVGRAQTRDSLDEIREDINSMLDTLRDEIDD